MSQDKLHEMDDLLSQIFREPPPISTDLRSPFPPEPEPPKGEELAAQPPTVEPATEMPPADFRTEITPADPPTEIPAVAPLTDADNAARRAHQAKSLLAGLDLDTAIRLRWAMRDIRGKRTKTMPVSENDLAALIDLDFVEMRDGMPRLTGLGILALD